MKVNLVNRMLGLVTIGIIYLMVSGCSAIFFAIGAISDSTSPKTKNIPGWQIGSLTEGDTASLFLQKSDSLNGKYLGLVDLTNDDYSQILNDVKRADSNLKAIPDIGEIIKINSGHKATIEARFAGFEYQYQRDYLFSKTDGAFASYFIRDSIQEKKTIEKRAINGIKMVICQNEDTLKGPIIRSCLLEGKIPTVNAVEFISDSTINRFQVAQIDSVRIGKSNNTKWVMGAVGLVIDVIIIIKSNPFVF